MSRNKTKRRRSAVRIKIIYLISGVITALIIGILVLDKTGNDFVLDDGDSGVAVTAPSDTGVAEPVSSPQSVDVEPLASTGNQSGNSASSSSQEAKPIPDKRIYIVIDDVGHNLADVHYLLKFPGKLTFAVLPDLAYTRQSIDLLKKNGKAVIIHQPMAPQNDKIDPGARALYPGMGKQEVWSILQRNFQENPYAIGMNNHMGSLATEDSSLMSYVMEYLNDHGKIFLDSWTTPRSVALDTALDYKLSATKRSSMFLDNQRNREAILNAIFTGLEETKKKGHAVMIGHAITNELVDVLIDLYPKLIDEGYSFHDISEMFLLGDFR